MGLADMKALLHVFEFYSRSYPIQRVAGGSHVIRYQSLVNEQ
jgi:hypothetical protein